MKRIEDDICDSKFLIENFQSSNLRGWIKEMIELCKPDEVMLCDGITVRLATSEK